MTFNKSFSGRRKKSRRRRGTSAVEFALILPVLLAIVLGCVDFGRFAYTYIVVTNAARVGAGFASANPFTVMTRPDWENDIRKAVVAEICSPSNEQSTLDAADALTKTTFLVTTETNGQRRVRLTVSYPFEMEVQWPFLPEKVRNMEIEQTVEMRMVDF
jgi:Flp pilus assembly protein TadG